jgi:hypothetical protein
MSKIVEHNAETNEIIVRDKTAAEQEQEQKDLVSAQAAELAKIERINKKNALLDKLGITADEAKLLLS